jgi:hypothetical protein
MEPIEQSSWLHGSPMMPKGAEVGKCGGESKSIRVMSDATVILHGLFVNSASF